MLHESFGSEKAIKRMISIPSSVILQHDLGLHGVVYSYQPVVIGRNDTKEVLTNAIDELRCTFADC